MLFLFAALSRFIFLPYAEITDADAVTRIFTADDLINAPRIISEGVWLPLHYYFISISILMSGELWYGPMIFHILIAAATVFPLYRFTAREFTERGAFWAVLVYCLSPIVFRNSFHALSGIPNAFLIALVLDALSSLRHTKSFGDAIKAGIYMTLACGFRYESWLLFTLFTGMLLLFRVPWKKIAVFWLLGMIIPIFWMIGNYVAHGHLFYGITGVYNADVVEMQNADLDLTEKVKRLIFFPLSWVLNFSPLIAVTVVFLFFRKVFTGKLLKRHLLWMIPFIVIFIVFIYKSLEGTLLNQQRFTILLILLAAPFVSFITELRNRIMKGILLLSVPFTFVWAFYAVYWDIDKYIPQERLRNVLSSIRLNTYSSLSPIPRQTDPEIRNVMAVIDENKEKCDGLLMDFWTWESSFCMALNSGFHHTDVFIVDGAVNGGVYEKQLADFLRKHKNLMVLFNCSSELLSYTNVVDHKLIFRLKQDEFTYPFYEIYSKDGMLIEKCTEDQGNKSMEFFSCPEKGTLSFYRMKIRQKLDMLNLIKQKAASSNQSFENVLQNVAGRLFDDNQ